MNRTSQKTAHSSSVCGSCHRDIVPAGMRMYPPLSYLPAYCLTFAGEIMVSHLNHPRLSVATTTMVHVRVDEDVKAQATETLAAMGLTMSDAIRVFLMRVVADKELPFTIKAPNATSRAAMQEADDIVQARRARFMAPGALLNDLEEASRK